MGTRILPTALVAGLLALGPTGAVADPPVTLEEVLDASMTPGRCSWPSRTSASPTSPSTSPRGREGTSSSLLVPAAFAIPLNLFHEFAQSVPLHEFIGGPR